MTPLERVAALLNLWGIPPDKWTAEQGLGMYQEDAQHLGCPVEQLIQQDEQDPFWEKRLKET